MKRIIKNHTYSTESSTFLGEYSNGKNIDDDYYIYEALYLKTNGDFFLFCKGGPKTMYSKKIDSKRVYNEDIEPISYEDAEEWAKNHLTEDKYEVFFTFDKKVELQQEDAYPRETFTVRMSKEYKEKLKAVKARMKITYPELMVKMIDYYINSID